ncbi:hypothetical protein PCH_Pc16g07980 [Penicillium rubens Wisconsin 54-1255]|uniref:Uncharacterized protein n=1 Tax=Penicillium rubens (strain ATCC 28089 / DSM 1075 / NRRL 1951 / Wisconsin 54-1255) TaxID=500485 RepID=B6H8A3_PENRW|nr:hypothetical protein PCH_Pc16g07980 [Penicillium rubens Wisconsin 54-1255]
MHSLFPPHARGNIIEASSQSFVCWVVEIVGLLTNFFVGTLRLGEIGLRGIGLERSIIVGIDRRGIPRYLESYGAPVYSGNFADILQFLNTRITIFSTAFNPDVFAHFSTHAGAYFPEPATYTGVSLRRLDPGLGGYLGDYSMLALLPNYLAEVFAALRDSITKIGKNCLQMPHKSGYNMSKSVIASPERMNYFLSPMVRARINFFKAPIDTSWKRQSYRL